MTTAARATAGGRLDPSGFALHMVGGIGVAAAALLVTPMLGRRVARGRAYCRGLVGCAPSRATDQPAAGSRKACRNLPH